MESLINISIWSSYVAHRMTDVVWIDLFSMEAIVTDQEGVCRCWPRGTQHWRKLQFCPKFSPASASALHLMQVQAFCSSSGTKVFISLVYLWQNSECMYPNFSLRLYSCSQWPEENLNETVTPVNKTFAGWTGLLQAFQKCFAWNPRK